MYRRRANKDQERTTTTTTTTMTSRYVGVNQLEVDGQGQGQRLTGPSNPTNSSVPQSGRHNDTKRLVQVVVTLLLTVRLVWAFSHWTALLLISMPIVGWVAYSLRQNHLHRQAILRSEAERLERQRRNRLLEEEAEAMVRESAKMTLEIDRQHLEDYLSSKHQKSSTTAALNSISYEQWIGELHPDNILPDGGGIDHRFYVEESDHRIMWNEMMGDNEALKVKTISLQPVV